MQAHCVRILKQTSLHTHHQACWMSRVKLVPLSMCALWPPSPHFPQTPAPCHSHAIRGKDDPTVAWKGSRNLCVQVAPRVCSPVLCWVQPSVPVDDSPPPFPTKSSTMFAVGTWSSMPWVGSRVQCRLQNLLSPFSFQTQLWKSCPLSGSGSLRCFMVCGSCVVGVSTGYTLSQCTHLPASLMKTWSITSWDRKL